ncbi:MAG TPA: chemotaxis protein CheW [Gemmatimonadaceae bacterium]|nr:chemotaxis protein CheW [Gemmatimonadaceae bacterium]
MAQMSSAVFEGTGMAGGQIAVPSGRVALLTFVLGELCVGLPLACISEVARAVAITALPQAPAIVEGVVNVRGELAPVLDVRGRFRQPAVPLHPDQHFVVARAGARLVVLRVDRVTDVLEVESETIESVAHAVPGVEYVQGVAKRADGLLVIHDLETFLALDEAAQVDRAIARARASDTERATHGGG